MTKDDSYYLQHPGQQKFYQYMCFVGAVFALNTDSWTWFQRPKSKLFDLQRIVVLIFVPITVGSQIIYLLLNFKKHDFATLATILSIIPFGFVVMVQTASAQSQIYKEALGTFMEKIHLINYLQSDFTEHKRKFLREELIMAERYIRWTFISLSSAVFICLTSWNIVPIIHNIRNNPSMKNITVRLEVCIHFWQPFDYEWDFNAYLFIQILGTYCGTVAVTMMVIYDTINLAFVFHLVGHIKLIKYDLTTGFTDDLNEEQQKKKLVELTKYYYFITCTFQDVTAVFGLNVAFIYGQNLFQGGLLLYQLTSTGRDLETILTFGLMIPICMGKLLLISYVLENVRIEADDIPSLVYALPWEDMSIPNKRIIMSIIFQVQPTLEFIAAFNIKTGMQPAINIIKTTFSYYVMIKSSKELV